MTESRRTRQVRLELLVAAVALVAAGVLSACGGAASPRADEHSTSSTSTAPTATTEPPGTDPAAVQPIVVDLLGRLDRVETEIVGDPAAAINDPNSPALAELREIFAPGEAYDGRINMPIATTLRRESRCLRSTQIEYRRPLLLETSGRSTRIRPMDRCASSTHTG